QSFQATSTGRLTRFSIYKAQATSGATVSVKVFAGTGTSGTQLFSATGIAIADAAGLTAINFPLAGAPNVVSGQSYSVEIFNASQLFFVRYYNATSYATGSFEGTIYNGGVVANVTTLNDPTRNSVFEADVTPSTFGCVGTSPV